MTTIADLRAACAAGTVLAIGHHRQYRYRIVAVAPCDGPCPIGTACVGTVDLALIGCPDVPVDRCHVADTYVLPVAALPVAA